MTVVNGFRVLESSTEVFRFGYDNTNERLVAGNINKGDLPNVMVTLDNGNTGQVAYIKDSSGNIGWKSIEANKINNTNSTSNVTVNDSNEIRFDTNNTERIVINNSGDVNITSNISVGGTTTLASLTATSNVILEERLTIGQSTQSGHPYPQLDVEKSTSESAWLARFNHSATDAYQSIIDIVKGGTTPITWRINSKSSTLSISDTDTGATVNQLEITRGGPVAVGCDLSVSGKVTVPNAALNGGTNYFWIQDNTGTEMFRIHHSSGTSNTGNNLNDQIVVPRSTTKIALGKSSSERTDTNLEVNGRCTFNENRFSESGGISYYTHTHSYYNNDTGTLAEWDTGMNNLDSVGKPPTTSPQYTWDYAGYILLHYGTNYSSQSYIGYTRMYGSVIEFYTGYKHSNGGSWGTRHKSMTIDRKGFVGIGEHSPYYPLDITARTDGHYAIISAYGSNNNYNSYTQGTQPGGPIASGFQEYGFNDHPVALSDPNGNTGTIAWENAEDTQVQEGGGALLVAMRAQSGSVWISGGNKLVFTSDERIKTNITNANIQGCLDKVNEIPTRQYNYIDYVNRGTSNSHGYIAQEVESVFAEATNKHIDYIPNVYCTASNIAIIQNSGKNNEIKFDLPSGHGITTGDNLKILTPESDYTDVKVTLAMDREIHVNFTRDTSGVEISETDTSIFNSSNIVIYGKLVTDFTTVDKTKISVLHHGAIQCLSQENAELKVKVSTLESQMSNLMTWATSQGYTI